MTEINRYNYEFFLSEVDDSRVPVERSQRSHDIDMFVPPRRREDRDPNEDTVRPYFDDDIQTNVSFQLTKTAYIHCTIHAVNDKVVSFVRQRDLHILTIGKYTYTTDQRFAAYHLNDTIVWTLEIRDTRRTDTGIYECQVSSDPKMSLPIQLNIIAGSTRASRTITSSLCPVVM
ncbi:uncharacterized protein CDAR_69971 [Caerostris darwini]|uniref:Ig-like domain-containing protein n=1 Tax=Caerostris darwini TaxID=1538125 RepID=A0AAV4SZ97_9ARAC|nr:uncharacterized protein CDAR_69971 [Caerostris darwini]